MSRPASSLGPWIGVSTVLAVAVTVYMFAQPQRGASVAAGLSLAGTLVATGLTIRTAVRAQQEAVTGESHPPSTAVKFWAAAGLAASLLVPSSVWVWNRWFSDLDVTYGNAVDVREGVWTVVVPDIDSASGWKGGELVFTPVLQPVSDLSDCVVPSILRVEPRLDGRAGTEVPARHDEQSSINIPDRTDHVELGLQLDAPADQICIVKVSFKDSQLRR
jgi:hypothetical protein